MTDQLIMDRAAEIAQRNHRDKYFNLPVYLRETLYNIAVREIADEDEAKVDAVMRGRK